MTLVRTIKDENDAPPTEKWQPYCWYSFTLFTSQSEDLKLVQRFKEVTTTHMLRRKLHLQLEQMLRKYCIRLYSGSFLLGLQNS
jgi:hypothetical protein